MANLRIHVLALLPLLAACQQTVTVDTVAAAHAQFTMPDNSALGEACDGHHPTAGVKLAGASFLLVRADIQDVSDGTPRPWSKIAAPAYEGVTQLPRPVFTGEPGDARCGGTSIRTVVLRENGVMYLDYAIEIAEPQGPASVRPVSPWRVQGRLPVDETRGTAGGRVGFTAFGRPFVAYLAATPGPVWAVEKARLDFLADEAKHPTRRFATPLPDEMPGRTLRDAMRPAVR